MVSLRRAQTRRPPAASREPRPEPPGLRCSSPRPRAPLPQFAPNRLGPRQSLGAGPGAEKKKRGSKGGLQGNSPGVFGDSWAVFPCACSVPCLVCLFLFSWFCSACVLSASCGKVCFHQMFLALLFSVALVSVAVLRFPPWVKTQVYQAWDRVTRFLQIGLFLASVFISGPHGHGCGPKQF